MMKKLQKGPLLSIGLVLLMCMMLFILCSISHWLFINISKSPRLFPFLYTLLAISASYAVALYIRGRPEVFMVCVGIISLLATLVLVLNAQTEPVSDFSALYSFAIALANGNVEMLRTSAYLQRWAYQSAFVVYEAAVISIYPAGITPLLVCNALFMTGIVELLYLITRTIYQEKTARFIALVYLLCPSQYCLSSVLTNQHISLFFLLFGMYVVMRNVNIKNGIIGGVLLAAGNAMRPDGIPIIAALVVLILIILLRPKTEWVVPQKWRCPLCWP